jgi:SAM-dependent methyltransferase
MKTRWARTDANFLIWLLFVFLPRKISSWFVTRTPTVYAFGAAGASRLAAQLQSVNVLAPTRACRVMTKLGSDKGRRWHNYTTVYSALFRRFSDKQVRIFELGLGTNNPDLVSSMGSTGRPGSSLRGWRELFPAARIFGADIDRAILFQEDRIKTFYCDQLDRASIAELWSQPELRDGVDVLIEDGLHTFEANVSFLEGSLQHLRHGGIYIIEDVGSDTIETWRDRLETVYAPEYPDYEFVLLVLPNPVNRQDNNLLVVRRKA